MFLIDTYTVENITGERRERYLFDVRNVRSYLRYVSQNRTHESSKRRPLEI